DLLTSNAQASITRDKFVARYQAIADEATITKVTPSFTPPADKQADQMPFSVTYTTALFGDVKQDLTIQLQHEGDGWRIQWSPSLIFAQLGASNLVHTFIDKPNRGAILARDGTPLAMDATVGVAGTSRDLINNPQTVKDPQSAINAIAQALGLNPSDVQRKVSDTSTPSNYFIPLKTLPFSTTPAQRAALEAIPGMVIQDTTERVYPLGAAAAHVVGYVSRITAEQYATLKNQGYGLDDLVGQAGIEAAFEQQLAGKPSARLTIISPDGDVVQELAKRDGTPPMDVITTLDVNAQKAAYSQLSNGNHTGAVVLMDPNDNSVLAMASNPSFDPNLFVQGLTDAQANQLFNDPKTPLLNRATQATFPPGSTFKVITTSAGLESGIITPQTTLPCPGVWYGLGQNQPKANWRPDNLGNINVVDALMTSCDPFFYQVGLELDHKDPNILPSFAADFGYGRPTGISGVDEAAGIDPNPDWKQKTQGQPWYTGDSVNMAIGQGYLLVTPIQVANAFSAIAHDADLRTPLLVSELRPSVNGQQPQTFQSKLIDQIPISATTLQNIREGMRRVVQDPRGTAYDVFKGSTLNPAGKSGTAEDAAAEPSLWFVAFAPLNAPKAVAVVMLDEGQSGSEEAGPIARAELEAYLGR
ncbi:MAG TPA: penicillin-binding protein 2, partial [Dehalococcoidia bacterium]|nr:penicillin-binding protein 2 [Dehalococcoidia bacterium]